MSENRVGMKGGVTLSSAFRPPQPLLSTHVACDVIMLWNCYAPGAYLSGLNADCALHHEHGFHAARPPPHLGHQYLPLPHKTIEERRRSSQQPLEMHHDDRRHARACRSRQPPGFSPIALAKRLANHLVASRAARVQRELRRLGLEPLPSMPPNSPSNSSQGSTTMLIVTILRAIREVVADALELRRVLALRYPHLRGE